MGVYEDLLKRKKIIEDEQGNVVSNNVVDKNIRRQLNDNNIQTYNIEETKSSINKMKNVIQNTATKTIWDRMQDVIISNKSIKPNNIIDSFRNNMSNSINEELNPTNKNKNIIQDTGSLAKLVGLGASTGGKEVFNYIESANENNFSGYNDLRKRQFLTSQKVNEEDKAKAKTQNNLLLSSNGIKTADENRVETNLVKKAIRDSINKDNEKIQEEQSKMSNQATKKLAEIAPSMGQMLPGMALNAVNPILGTAYFTTSAGGGYIDDALNRGMNEQQAFKYGTVMGALEGASESIITGQQLSKVKKAFTGKEISKKLLNSYGFNIFENAVQEAVMEPAQEITAGIVGDKADWSNMGSRMLESGFNGALMGAISNGVTFGLEKSGNVYDKIKNGENITETEYKEALQENINKFGKNAVENAMKNGATEVYQEINNIQQQSTQNEQILPTQQINQEQNNIAQNENIEQVLPTQNNYKNQAINEINNSYLDNQSKQNLIQEISNIEVNEEGLNQIRQIITEQSKLDTNATYKTDNNRKRTYMQYKNSDVNYDTTALDIALDSVKENRNGKRTVKQWLEVADNLGKQISDKSNSEIEQIAFRSWHDLQPNTKDSITRYDNRNKTNVPFQKFTSDDWVNTIYKAVNETRENSQQNIANNQETLYNNIKIGETKNINTNQLLDLISEGGYRTEEQINNLREDIKKNGITTPIEIYRKNDGTFAIENGNHRLKIAQGLGIKDIPVKMVESWENIGINRDVEPDIKKEVDIDYDGSNGISETINNVNETSGNREGLLRNDNKQLEDRGTTERNVNFPTRESNSDEQTSSIGSKENNRNIKDSNQSSFNLPQKEKVNLPTKGETINWNEIERPEGKIRKHYRSIIESSNTTKEAKAIAKEMMGLDTYTPQSNESLLQKADSRISTTNPETELKSLLSRVMNNEKVNDVDMAVGERLIEYYSKIGDSEHLQDAIHATALAGTQAGRTVQAMALLNHMTPQGQVVWLERSVNKANKELEQKFKNKKNIPQFELTSDMTEKILNTKSKEEMYKVLDDVYEELGQQVPKTTLEKIDEWRYFSMLANIKTHGRNMIGNLAMNLTQRAKNKVAGAIEGTVAKFNPEMERTHTIVPTSKKVKDFAKNDVKNIDVQTELGMNENKYNPQSRLQSARRTFKSDVLENTLGKMFDLNSKLLEVEDNIGLKSMYVKSLGEYITANKIDIDNMTDAQLSKARQHAIKEAQEATFHQASALATALNQMGRKNNIAKFALDSAVPFKKTPINVAKTGVQYSPVGLIKSAVYDVGKLRKGDITVNQYIDNVSKGLTGTGIAYLGYVLAEAGILKASGSDDDKKEKYEEEQGKQSYSIEIGGKTYSLDWLSPVGIPLFIGAEINQQFNTSKKEKNSKSNDDNETLNQIVQSVANIANASANAMNPMSEMSMISGLTSVLSSYNKENAVGDMIVNTGKSYINQFVPTALGQLARTTDDYERTTKSTKTEALEKAVDSTINQIKSKIPGLRQTLPTKTDIWGKDIKQSENLPFRAFNNFINPAKVQDVSTDKVDKELNSLYAKTGESSIIPKAIDRTLTIDKTNYRLTNEEYAKYYKNYGKTSYSLIKELINSSDYKNLTDEQKQKAIKNVYEYAKESNKLDYARENKLEVKESTLYKTMNELKGEGGKQSSYINYMASTSGMTKESEKNEVLLNSNYDSKTKSVIYSNGTGKDDNLYNNIKNSNIDINEYLKYKTQDSNGKFSKEKTYNYVNSNITGYNNKLLILGSKYKLSRSEQEKLANYIYQISTSVEDKNNLFDYYSKNFTINNGKVYYK